MSALPTGFKVEMQFDAPSGAWFDVTSYVRSGSISRGSSRADGLIPAHYEAGSCTLVLDNRDARFDPTNTLGPYVDPSGPEIFVRPDNPRIRISATVSGSPVYIFSGFAASWTCSYPNGGKDAITTAVFGDAIRMFNAFDGTPWAVAPIGDGEASGNRISRILSWWGWPGSFGTTDVDITSKEMNIKATTLTGNPWAEMQLTADSEIGEIFVTAGGVITFRDRESLFSDFVRIQSQAVFGDSGTELRFADIAIQSDDVQIRTTATIKSADGYSASALGDAHLSAVFGERDYVRQDLLFYDFGTNIVSDYAHFVIAILCNPDARVESISILPNYDRTNLFPQVLQRELGDRITVRYTPPGRNASNRIAKDCHIRGISHSFTPENWETVWALSDASRWDVARFDGSATNSAFDVGRFGF